MAAAKGGAKKPAAKSGPAKSTKKTRKLHTLYTLSGDKVQRKNRSCPKCGQGYFLGVHANRLVCGKCAYVEYVTKK
ncbi:30S ribosomal protein S27ae [Candidatus Woesearchaeota archaeon]|nr:30S ribosomal protein S27ae [Candidatus Woesearchaeota archaeon]